MGRGGTRRREVPVIDVHAVGIEVRAVGIARFRVREFVVGIGIGIVAPPRVPRFRAGLTQASTVIRVVIAIVVRMALLISIGIVVSFICAVGTVVGLFSGIVVGFLCAMGTVVAIGVVVAGVPTGVASVADPAQQHVDQCVGAALLLGAGVAGLGDGGDGRQHPVDRAGIDGGHRRAQEADAVEVGADGHVPIGKGTVDSFVLFVGFDAGDELVEPPAEQFAGLHTATSTTTPLSNCLEVS